MKLPNRQQVAEELVPLRHPTMVPNKRLRTERATKLVNNVNKVQLGLMVELYLTHFTNKQLLALREFYDSDIGRSIAATEREIYEDYQEQVRGRIAAIEPEIERPARPSSGVYVGSFPPPDRDD
jgi:Uncharacterized protein conserved in bacteria (DUF2059)